MALVFQYGSNTESKELYDRLGSEPPDLGRARTVELFRIAFNKPSTNRGCATADLIGPDGGGRLIWGVIYDLAEAELQKLARDVEGPSYEPKPIIVRNGRDEELEAATFVVKEDRRRDKRWTSAEYVGYIVGGLRSHGVPEDYVQSVITRECKTNCVNDVLL